MKSLTKKLLLVAFTVAMIVCAMVVTTSAATTSDGFVYINYFSGTAITDYTGSATEVVIPETINGSSVTQISDYAFGYCNNIKSITIPKSITKVGKGVFTGCSSLESIVVKKGNSKYHSTSNCIIETATKTLVAGCKTSIIPCDGMVSSIGEEAFRNCDGLKSITIPKGIISIGEESFYSCDSLKSITIPNSVTSIGCGAFKGCSGLTSISLPFVGSSRNANESRDAVLGFIFGYESKDDPDTSGNLVATKQNYCSTMYANYYIPSRLKSVTITDAVQIPYGAFSNCKNITSITVPKSVTSIRREAFRSCTGLTSIKIPEGVKSIDDYAFFYCKSLENITIPKSVTSIGDWVFAASTSFKSITIPKSVVSIGNYVFTDCTSLSSITLPDSITSIGEGAFSGCTSLVSITLPDGIKSIMRMTFHDCTKLRSINIPILVSNIGEEAFFNCSSLTEITLPERITAIQQGTFRGCKNLKSVTVTYSLKQIGADAFFNCSSLKNVYVCGLSASLAGVDIASGNMAFVLSDVSLHNYAAATCTKAKTCKGCGAVKGKALGHSYKTSATVKATLTKNGTSTKKCTRCAKVASKTTIKAIKTVKLAATEYTYTGRAIKPAVTVKDSAGKVLKKGTDYTVKYASGCKNVGTYKVTITFKGNYSGTKTLTFKINPQKITLGKVTGGKNTLTIAWTPKIAQATGYEIQYSLKKNLSGAKTVTVKSAKTKTTTVKKLTKGKTYYVRIRAYKTVNGKKLYSAWSAVKSAKIK